MIRDNGDEQVNFDPRMQLSCECFNDIMPSHFLAVSVFIIYFISFTKTKNTTN